MRYVWDRFDDYFPKSGTNFLRYELIKRIASRLRRWDLETAGRVDLFIANSRFVEWRINKYYDRPAAVIHPPVDTEYYTPGSLDKSEFYLTSGALVSYKKTDVIIEAFRNLDEKLVVTGDGPEMKKLVYAAPDNVDFTGWLDRVKLRDYYRNCKALIFAGVEDFGIIPVEVQACGKPVIAFGQGGLLDSVTGPSTEDYMNHRDFKSGLFFNEQSPESIRKAVDIFKKMEFDSEAIARHAQKYSGANFSPAISKIVSGAYDDFKQNRKIGLDKRMLS